MSEIEVIVLKIGEHLGSPQLVPTGAKAICVGGRIYVRIADSKVFEEQQPLPASA